MIRVIDIETTGIDPATDSIIEIASVDMVRDDGITNAMDTLVRPTKPIPRGASAGHPVDEHVANAPAFSEVIDRFKGADFYNPPTTANSSEASLPRRASSLVRGSARTNARCGCGPSSKALEPGLRCALGRATAFPGSTSGSFRQLVSL